MNTAFTAKGLTVEERKARLAALVANGDISAEHAALIDFREPTAAVKADAARIAEKLKARKEPLAGASR